MIKQRHFLFEVVADGRQVNVSEALAIIDLEEVWHEGAMTTHEMLRNMFGLIEPGLDWRLEVFDDTGEAIYRFSFKAERLKASESS